MNYYPIGNNIWIYLFDMAIIEAMAIYTWRFRKLPGAMPYIVHQACKGGWLLALVLADMSVGLPAKKFWIQFREMMAIFSPYLWLLFVWQLSQQGKKLPYGVKYGFLGLIVFLWLAILSNSWHGLYWSNAWLDGQTIKFALGPIDWLAMANSYLLCVISTVLSVRWVLATVGLRRRQALWFVMPALFTLAGNIMTHIPACRIFVPQPLGFLLSGVFVAWAYYRWGVYSLLPLAREVAAHNMIDGLLIIDEQDFIVSINPAAKTMLRGLPAISGGRFQDLAAAWPALAAFDSKPGMDTLETAREDDGKCRYYQLSRIPLNASGGHPLGQILLLTDITRQKEDQKKMLEQQKTLSILTERNRLGRELHDMQGQFPGYVKTQAQAIRLLLQKQQLPKAVQQLEALIKAADAAFTDVRVSITDLKVTAADGDFFQSLRTWLNQFRKIFGIATDYSGPESVPSKWILPAAEVQLLRIIQEALTNIRKHSGAGYVRVTFTFHTDRLAVTIADDGCGFDAEKIQDDSAKFGLTIIRERAAEIHGICTVNSAPGRGTIVTVDIPLRQTA